MSIKQKLINGAIWNSVSQFGSQGINFILTIILARLLSPSDFGLLGQVAVMTGFLSYFTEFGITPSLIQKKNPSKTDCDTAFYMMFFFAITVYVLVYFLAPGIALFYQNEKLIPIVRVLFIQFLITPLAFVHAALETKHLNYKIIAFSDLISLFISGITGIILAYRGYGVWSLVIQSLVNIAVRSVLIMIATPYNPGLSFSFSCFKGYLKSGMHFTYRNVTLYFGENTDFLLIGKILGANFLGIYTLAFKMSNYPFTKVQQIFGKMLFPAFHLYEGDREKIRQIYIKLNIYGAVFLVPLILAIFFGIEHIVNFLLGEKWSGTVPIVKILSVYLVFSSISFADDPLLITFNKIKTVNLFKTLAGMILFIGGYFATLKFGVNGMASVFTLTSIIYILTMKYLILKILKVGLMDYFLKMLQAILLIILFAAVFAVYRFYMTKLLFPSVYFLAGEGIVFSFLMMLFLGKKGFFDIKNKKINPDVL